jgi:F-type H+-transporting ATPase subunit delta
VAAAHRIYARAIFEAAQGQGRLQAVHRELAEFSAAVAENAELRGFLRNPEVDPTAKQSVLRDIAAGGDQLTRNFLLLAAATGRAGEIEEIAAELDRLVAAEERRLTVELTTAVELSDAEAGVIVAQIEQASGRSVEAVRKVDPTLIGGLVLQVGTRRVDASVRGRLQRLRQDLVTR